MDAPQEEDGDATPKPPPTASARLVPEYGVVHVRNALSAAEQQELWALTRPYVSDPAGRATGFSGFCVCKKDGSSTRVPAFDRFARRLFALAAAELVKQMPTAEACRPQPSYAHLYAIAQGKETVLGEIFGNCYRPEATLFNHCDSDKILFSMSLALGDDCEFVIGRRTHIRAARTSNRSGKEVCIRMRSGDAVFFDGGLVPHAVKRIIPNTAPQWWGGAKMPNGSRCVIVFREKEKDLCRMRPTKSKTNRRTMKK